MTDASTRSVTMSRLVRLEDADSSFDLEFWRRVGAEGRFAAAWQAVEQLVHLGKLDEAQLRLRRSAARLERRWS
jgi:hypothetical protein